jgi:hypothetical protein
MAVARIDRSRWTSNQLLQRALDKSHASSPRSPYAGLMESAILQEAVDSVANAASWHHYRAKAAQKLDQA